MSPFGDAVRTFTKPQLSEEHMAKIAMTVKSARDDHRPLEKVEAEEIIGMLRNDNNMTKKLLRMGKKSEIRINFPNFFHVPSLPRLEQVGLAFHHEYGCCEFPVEYSIFRLTKEGRRVFVIMTKIQMRKLEEFV